METEIKRQQVRAINRKLFAYDLNYKSDDPNIIDILVSNIITNYNAEDELRNVPTILRLHRKDITWSIINKITLLNPKSVIVEVNSNVFENNDSIEILKKLKSLKYKILVEINQTDTVFNMAKVIANYIKFDIKNLPENALKARFECEKLAFNVDTAEEYTLADAAGIELYEGVYFSDAEQIEIEDAMYSKMNFFQLIKGLTSDIINVYEIASIIMRDPLMTAQVLRLANSKYFKQDDNTVMNISDAILLIGVNNFKKWIFLLQFSRSNNINEELIMKSYHRANFARIIMKNSRFKPINNNDAYLIGLLSLLDVLTGKPMEVEINNLMLNDTISDALVYRDGIGGTLLNLIRAYEEANLSKIHKYSKPFFIDNEKLFKLYFKSLKETKELWRELNEKGKLI